jgi:serine O-acetyltransferase
MDKFSEWMGSELPKVVSRLEGIVQANHTLQADDGLDLAGRNEIYEILDDILAVLFPSSYSKHKVSRREMNFFITDMLGHIAFRLRKHIAEVFTYRCRKENCRNCSCEDRAEKAIIHVMEVLPEIRIMLLEDIQAAHDGDPAAHDFDEIILSYPCVEAIATYRTAHLLYKLDVPIIPRVMAERAHSRTGIDIHPGAEIGRKFFIDHGTGVVIGETTRIGNSVKIYQGVTLGALSPFDQQGNPRRGEKRHPNIEDDVIIYANATILGGRTVIGKGCVIGGNTWITRSVAPGEHVYNKPIGQEASPRARA